MDDGGKAAALAQQQQHQQLMQQQLLLQQIQRQKDAISRFPSNIDAHLRPQGIHPLLHHHARPPPPPQNPNSSPSAAPQQPQTVHPIPNSSSAATSINSINPQQQQQHKASIQLAYQDAWRVCHPDFKRPFSSLEDACERLLPYHVVADYEAEEDDKILDSDTTGQILSRSQQWDYNIAAKVAEFTATFEKQVLAFNIISRKRGLGEFRTEEKLMMEQLLLQDEKRALFELRVEMESRQKASRETEDANMRMAAMAAQAEQARAQAQAQAHAEMMSCAPIRGSALGSRGNSISIGPDMGEQGQDVPQEDIMNGWGSNAQKDDKEPSEDFLNDDDAENGDTTLQSEWHGGDELDLNAR